MRCSAALVLLIAALAGCSATSETKVAPASAGGPGELGRCGLLVHRWRVLDPVDDSGAASLDERLRSRDVDPPRDPEAEPTTLERNGFLFVRVERDLLETLQSELGGTIRNVRSWHGQAIDWRPIAERGNDQRARGVAINGRPRRFEGGAFSLAIRGWYLPMEDGPRFHVELQPEYAPPDRRPAASILPRELDPPERFPEAHVEFVLEPGYVYVLTTDASTLEGGTGPAPPVAAAMTLGELLLVEDVEPRSRDLVILEPVVPESFFPPGGLDA